VDDILTEIVKKNEKSKLEGLRHRVLGERLRRSDVRVWRILAITLLFITLATATACNPLGGKAQADQQRVEVARGDLLVKVNGIGKTGVATEAN